MQSRRAVAFYGGTTVVLLVMLVILAPKRERPPLSDPVVRGKPMSRWVQEVARSGDNLDEAMQAFLELPKPAAQHLEYVIRQRPSRFKQWLRENWGRLPGPLRRFIQYPNHPDNPHLAVLALGELKLDDRVITKTLVSCLLSDGASRDSAMAEQYRSFGALGLEKRTPLDADLAVPALGACLHDKSTNIRVACARGLAAFGTNSSPFVKDLIQLVQSENEGVRWSSANALGKIGPAAKPAIPVLKAALARKDYKSSQLHRVLAMALWRIDPQSVSPLPYLLGALESAEPHQKPGLVRDLLSVDERQASKALDVLTNLVIDPLMDKWARSDAARTLGKLGGIANAAVPALCIVTNESDIKVRTNAIWALSQIEQNSKNAK